MTWPLNTAEEAACPILPDPGNYHFELVCEDCDVERLAAATLGQVEERYRTGRVNQDEFEAYMHVWAVLSPHGGRPEWRDTPAAPAVRRIARKLCRALGQPVPAVLADGSARPTTTLPTLAGAR